jgi:two-component system, cell cycle response regulator
MRRFKDSFFDDLNVWFVGLGTGVGVILPLVLGLIGIPTMHALHWTVFLATTSLGAGLGYGAGKIAERIIRPYLRDQVVHMREACETMREASLIKVWPPQMIEQCMLPVKTDDEMGQTAETFNELVDDLVRVYKLEESSTEQTETLSSKLDIGELCQEAMGLLLRQTEAVAGCLMVKLDGEMETVSNFGLSDTSGIIDSDRIQRAMETGVMQSVRLPNNISIDGVVTDFQPRQVILLPITYEGKTLGVVVLAADTMFGKDSMWILDLFTKGMGLALNNAVTHDCMQKIATLDPLTGVYNRRLGMTRLREEFLRAQRELGDLGVAMFDIDHFKNVNDTHGHLVGDKILTAVAETAGDVLRESDVIIRYGGEEFLVVLPGADRDTVKDIGERIRSAVEACTVVIDGTPLGVTVSVGLTNYDSKTQLEEDLLKEADDALYKAKEGGRNCVVCLAEESGSLFEPPPADQRPVACAVP